MTGLQSHHIPCYDFTSPFPSDLPTWAHMLGRAGYHTELDGRMHFMGPDQYHGFHRHINEPPHGNIAGFRWGEENPDPTTGLRYWRDLHHESDPVYEQRMALEERRVADAVSFLHRSARWEQPFCLTVGFFGPHYPQICTKEMFDSYADAPIPPPKVDEALHPRNEYWKRCWGFDRFAEADTAQGRQAYLAMVTHVDQWIGRILEALKRSGQAEYTIVIYSSDHGEMWGEHGLWGKQCFYEESVRVPLIVWGPGCGVAQGQRVGPPVSLLDLYPTFRDLGDCHDGEVPLDGRSLAPALQGESLASKPVFSEYYGPDIAGPERMVREGHWKLHYYHNAGRELFDLAQDPEEKHNRSGDPDCAEVEQRLLHQLLDGWDPEALDQAVRISQNRRTLIGESHAR